MGCPRGGLDLGMETARDNATRTPPCPTRYDAHELEGPAAPVQRYFRAVLKDGQAIVSAVTINMAASINMSATVARAFAGDHGGALGQLGQRFVAETPRRDLCLGAARRGRAACCGDDLRQFEPADRLAAHGRAGGTQ